MGRQAFVLHLSWVVLKLCGSEPTYYTPRRDPFCHVLITVNDVYLRNTAWDQRKAQQARVFEIKPANLNLISEIDMVEKAELILTSCPLNSIHMLCVAHSY